MESLTDKEIRDIMHNNNLVAGPEDLRSDREIALSLIQASLGKPTVAAEITEKAETEV